jgi:hypothetical protein
LERIELPLFLLFKKQQLVLQLQLRTFPFVLRKCQEKKLSLETVKLRDSPRGAVPFLFS